MKGLQEIEFENVANGELSDEQRCILYGKMKSVVVRVEVYSTAHGAFDCEGAGVFVSAEGHLLTLAHVFHGETDPRVRIVNNRIGENVYAIGHPLDYSYSVGRISHPLRSYGEVLASLSANNRPQRTPEEYKAMLDTSASGVCYTSEVDDTGLRRRVALVQLNNIHGDGLEGSRGTPIFDCFGHIVGIYAFAAHDQCFGIHARQLRSYIAGYLGSSSSAP